VAGKEIAEVRQDANMVCFEKDDNWASCQLECLPGLHEADPKKYRTDWSCSVLLPDGKKTLYSQYSKAHIAVGTKVEGLYSDGTGPDGDWYAATVAEALPHGQFLLDWDDGDTKERIQPRANIRVKAEAM